MTTTILLAAFTVFSWGGSKPISRAFCDRIGIDTVTDIKKTKTVIRTGKHVRIEEVRPVGSPLVAKRVGDEWIVKGDYAPAEARVFMVTKQDP